MRTHTTKHMTWNFLLCTAPLAVFALLAGSTGHDDSHITFWQAHTLLEYGDIRNYNGERLEQSSSLLHSLLTALLAASQLFSVVTSGYLVNALAALAVVALSLQLASRAAIQPVFLPALLTALTPFFSYWAFSGMETSLAAFCALSLIAAVLAWLQQPSAVSALGLFLAATALATVRPEMVMVGPLFLLLAAVLYRRASVLLFILPFMLACLWRHEYFGVWFPNPVYAKAADPGFAQWQNGWQYFLRLFRQPLSAIGVSLTLLLLVFSAIRLWRDPHQQQSLSVLCGLWLVIYTAFVFSSGGDWMKEGRFWVPLLPALWLLLCQSCLYTQLDKAIRWLIPVLLAAYCAVFIQQFSFGTPLWNHAQQRAMAGKDASFFEVAAREHLRDWPALHVLKNTLRILAPDNQAPLTIMSKQMGMVSFHVNKEFHGSVRVWDMAGLVDNTLRNCAVMAKDGFDRQGLRINYRKFFERLPQAQVECGLRAPDIIYDIYGWGESIPLPDFLHTQGYRIVFNQTGRVDMKPGADITAQEVVAVREALLVGREVQAETVDFSRLMQP